jgi:RNA polymerase sigma-70 factor (ECF subfamily)
MVMIADGEELRRKASMENDSKMASEGPLIARVRDDPAAFVQLYRRHYDAVFRYCVHRLFERATAEDITADVFLKVVENIGRFNGNEQQVRNWLYKIATNAVNQHLRKAVRREHLLRTAGGQVDRGAAERGESSQKLAILRDAVLALKPRYQTIITLRFFENMKLTEIAEVLGSSPGTIRSQLTRALAKLRRNLGAEFAEKSEDS